MKLKWIKRMSVGAAIAVLTAFFVVGCGSTEKQNNGSRQIPVRTFRK